MPHTPGPYRAAPAPATGPYHGPSLADQLRLIRSLAGTDDRRGHQDQRDAVAYVEAVTASMLTALKWAMDRVPDDGSATFTAALETILRAEGRLA